MSRGRWLCDEKAAQNAQSGMYFCLSSVLYGNGEGWRCEGGAASPGVYSANAEYVNYITIDYCPRSPLMYYFARSTRSTHLRLPTLTAQRSYRLIMESIW